MALFDKKDLEEMLSDIKTELAKKPGKKKIVFVDASSDMTVPAGSDEVITIQPPEGKIWRILHTKLRALPLSGATSGTHAFSIGYTQNIYDNNVTYHEANYNSIVDFFVWEGTPSKNFTLYETIKALQSQLYSNTYPLTIQYFNNTDADQTNKRYIKLFIEEQDEAT